MALYAIYNERNIELTFTEVDSDKEVQVLIKIGSQEEEIHLGQSEVKELIEYLKNQLRA